jgi:hypothetical protein
MKNAEQGMSNDEAKTGPFGEWALLAQSHPFAAGSRFQNSMFDIQRFKITLNFKKANT